MPGRPFRERLLRRLRAADVEPPAEHVLEQLEAYFQLLARWNEKINLTALPLSPPADATLDRLFVEPLCAARYLSLTAGANWFDVGSGGGSPAVPIKLLSPDSQLTLIESKARKAAFLREVARSLELARTIVENDRADVIADQSAGNVELVTVRAVRQDSALATVARKLLRSDGRLAVFSPSSDAPTLRGFVASAAHPLITAGRSYLTLYRLAFHVEQTR